MGGAMNTLTAMEAAQYLGMTVPRFRRAVGRNELPAPFIKGRPQLWSKIQIDWALEGRHDRGAPFNGADPIMDALNAL